MANIDIKELQKRIDDKLISVQFHDEVPLMIFNYTPVAQFRRRWDEYTLQARGLIVDMSGKIIARPFPKFFNFSEHDNPELPPISRGGYQVFDKMDGSLGILYKIDGKPYLATRGSFTSDQAKVGTRILRDRYSDFHFDDDKTYLFEIIYPQNRIVVDYKDMEDIVLLDVIETETGKSLGVEGDYPFPVVEELPVKTFLELAQSDRKNSEGYVLKFESGMRVKIKHAEYIRLHRLLTGVSSKSIWELLKNDQTLDEILDNIPDEFYDWVMETYNKILSDYHRVNDEALEDWENVPQGVPRAVQAAYIKETRHPAILFNKLNGKGYEPYIWKTIRPTYQQPFREDIDG